MCCGRRGGEVFFLILCLQENVKLCIFLFYKEEKKHFLKIKL